MWFGGFVNWFYYAVCCFFWTLLEFVNMIFRADQRTGSNGFAGIGSKSSWSSTCGWVLSKIDPQWLYVPGRVEPVKLWSKSQPVAIFPYDHERATMLSIFIAAMSILKIQNFQPCDIHKTLLRVKSISLLLNLHLFRLVGSKGV